MISLRSVGAITSFIVAIFYVFPGFARADDFPNRPVKIVVGFPAGGTIDALSRIVAERLGDFWKQSVVVDNRPGGGGNIGAVVAAHSMPDGYTLLMGGQPLSANMTLQPAPNFDPARDLEPVIFIGYAVDVLMVGRDSALHSVEDLLVAARSKPGDLNLVTLGVGSSADLASALFCVLADVKVTRVAYTSVGQALTDLIGGRVTFWLATLGGHLGNIQSGNLRALAVSGATRARELPNTPTFKEIGIDLVEPATWFGLFAPKGTPKDIVARIHDDLDAILRSPETRDRLEALGYTVASGSPEALTGFLAKDTAKWAKIGAAGAFDTP